MSLQPGQLIRRQMTTSPQLEKIQQLEEAEQLEVEEMVAVPSGLVWTSFAWERRTEIILILATVGST